MSLATRCTACGTVFRVVQDQLKVSEGWVRCGRCNEVFNALEGLFDLERDAPTGSARPPRPPAAAPGRHGAAADVRAGERRRWRPTRSLVDEIDAQLMRLTPTAEHGQTPARPISARDRARLRRRAVRHRPCWPTTTPAMPGRAHGLRASLEEAARAEPPRRPRRPSFVRQAQRAGALAQPAHARAPGRRPWLLLAALLACRPSITSAICVAARWPPHAGPGWRMVRRGCAARSSAPRRIDDMVGREQRRCRAAAQRRTRYRLSVVLRNRGSHAAGHAVGRPDPHRRRAASSSRAACWRRATFASPSAALGAGARDQRCKPVLSSPARHASAATPSRSSTPDGRPVCRRHSHHPGVFHVGPDLRFARVRHHHHLPGPLRASRSCRTRCTS